MSGFQNYFGNQDGFWKPFVSKDQPKITLGLLAYILGIGASVWIAQGNVIHKMRNIYFRLLKASLRKGAKVEKV